MNHRIFGKQLGRNHNQRQALFRSLVNAIFLHGHLKSTKAKVQAIIPTVEKLCTTAKKSDLIAYRTFAKYFPNRSQAKNVVDAVRKAFDQQTSNFTKTTNLKYRLGDQALIVKLAFTRPYQLETPLKVEAKAETKTAPKPVIKKKTKKA
ncbi:hypothetical protein A3K55_01100 [Candidatus Shapirobacteria bacterium RBG_13_44_7]|uniref:50S ribosomal protein L17 n=1 Tax=Candidatus Shapirobacteria bacterium RBG_13_44_7 TaxID=1802149 RepID=A0A1F7SIE4_9BACT|nr:MAG: hypothetical protein A3K55_01100 [Candidatus Shapirobacteria bacterium RBG_13_44_7]